MITDKEKSKLQADTGIPHLPTDLTYECRMAVSGEGPRAYDWSDKPHRLVLDLCREIERIAEISPAGVKTDQQQDIEDIHKLAGMVGATFKPHEPAGVGVENPPPSSHLRGREQQLEDALRNLMGCYDTPLSRRRFPPDDFMNEALDIARELLATTEGSTDAN